MRTLLIALAAFTLAVTGLSACSMYFGESSQSNQHLPDASNNGGGDAGWGNVDASEDGGGSGCGDAGHNPDGGDPWPTDAGWPTVDAAPWPNVDAAPWPVDASN